MKYSLRNGVIWSLVVAVLVAVSASAFTPASPTPVSLQESSPDLYAQLKQADAALETSLAELGVDIDNAFGAEVAPVGEPSWKSARISAQPIEPEYVPAAQAAHDTVASIENGNHFSSDLWCSLFGAGQGDSAPSISMAADGMVNVDTCQVKHLIASLVEYSWRTRMDRNWIHDELQRVQRKAALVDHDEAANSLATVLRTANALLISKGGVATTADGADLSTAITVADNVQSNDAVRTRDAYRLDALAIQSWTDELNTAAAKLKKQLKLA